MMVPFSSPGPRLITLVVSGGTRYKTGEVSESLSNPIPRRMANPNHQDLPGSPRTILCVPLGVDPVARAKVNYCPDQ